MNDITKKKNDLFVLDFHDVPIPEKSQSSLGPDKTKTLIGVQAIKHNRITCLA
jgi:hypothetical protein